MTNELTDLRSLIVFASKNIEKIFKKTHAIYPMYHAITARGDSVVLQPPPGDKDMSVAMVKAWLVLNDIETVVFFDEAWILDDRHGHIGLDMEKIRRVGISNHPDRREVIMISAENRRGEMLTAKHFILRPEIGKPSLSPLVIDEIFDHSEGRMVGLLNWEKSKR